MSTIYATATSIDGYIATSEHSLDWLLSRRTDPELGFERFLEGVGAAVMGASTYEWVQRQAGHAPWSYEMPTWVLTHRAVELAAARPTAWADADLRFGPGDGDDGIRAVHAAATVAAGERDVWVVGGGELAGRFADLGLLDAVQLDLAPCTLGSGQPLLPRRLELKLEELRPNGEMVQAWFSVVRAPGDGVDSRA